MPDPSYLALGESAAYGEAPSSSAQRNRKVLALLSLITLGLCCGLLSSQVGFLQVRRGSEQHQLVQDPAITLYNQLKASSQFPLQAPTGSLRHSQKASFFSPVGSMRELSGLGIQSPIAAPAGRFLHVPRAAQDVVDYCVDCGWVYKGRQPFNELPKDFVCPQCQSGLKRFGKKDLVTDKVVSGPGGGLDSSVIVAFGVAVVVLGGLGYVATTIS